MTDDAPTWQITAATVSTEPTVLAALWEHAARSGRNDVADALAANPALPDQIVDAIVAANNKGRIAAVAGSHDDPRVVERLARLNFPSVDTAIVARSDAGSAALGPALSTVVGNLSSSGKESRARTIACLRTAHLTENAQRAVLEAVLAGFSSLSESQIVAVGGALVATGNVDALLCLEAESLARFLYIAGGRFLDGIDTDWYKDLLAIVEDNVVRGQIIGRLQCPVDVVEATLPDLSDLVRRDVDNELARSVRSVSAVPYALRHPAAGPHTWRAVADWVTCKAPGLAHEALTVIPNDTDAYAMIAASLPTNPDTDAAVKAVLASSPQVARRVYAAAHPERVAALMERTLPFLSKVYMRACLQELRIPLEVMAALFPAHVVLAARDEDRAVVDRDWSYIDELVAAAMAVDADVTIAVLDNEYASPLTTLADTVDAATT